MAKIQVPKQQPPTEISKFLGLNEDVNGALNLALGEASKMLNYRVTPQYKLKEREGHETVFSGLTGAVQGTWYGKLNGTTFFLFCNNGHLYSGNISNGTKTDLGTLTDAPTSFIPFGTKVYLNNGHEYKSFDGTTFATVTGYRPKIAIGTPPTGGGTSYEQINLLNGLRRQTFNANGSATAYTLAESGLTSVDFVKVNGVTKTVTTDYTVNLTAGVVTFTVAPTTGQDNVEIGWTKGTGNRALIENCRFSMDYSGQTDSRVFLWGNTNYKNRRFWSGLADGVPSAEYFEANSFDDLGNGQYAITDIVKQYDRQKIYFENGAMYSYYSADTVGSQTIVSFPVFELNESVGQVAYGQSQIVKNMPLTLYSGVHAWEPTNVRDQTSEKLISDRVQPSLLDVDLSTAKTVNWKENNEYWINVGSTVWIFNYLDYDPTVKNSGVWYKFDNIQATCFLVINGELYFGTNGTIEKFVKDKRNDNGTAINAVWEMGFYDFGAEWRLKFMNNMWLSLNPQPKSRIDVQYVTNNDGTSEIQTLTYNLATFEHMDFSHFTFETSYNPQPFYLDVQAQQFDYFKVILKNSSLTETVTVLSINLPVRYGGKVR